MNLIKYIKMAFLFLATAIITSCSQKGVFLPKESVYFSIEDAVYSYNNGTYPIKLTDKPPFKQTVYRDATELLRLIMLTSVFYQKEEENNSCFVISCDDKYIYFGFLKESDSELYDKYSPIKKDNQDTYSIAKMKNTSELYNWAVQELNKGLVISINGNKERMYRCKSFNKDK